MLEVQNGNLSKYYYLHLANTAKTQKVAVAFHFTDSL